MTLSKQTGGKSKTKERVDMNGSTNSGHSSASDSVAGVDSASDGTAVIVADGDIVLCIEHELATGRSMAMFRARSVALKQHSKYFARLLEAGRFGEGSRVEEQSKSLKERYASTADVPVNELPIVTIQDVGRISHVKSITALMTDFLCVLHGRELQALPPLANLANLAVVADRFDALDAMKSYVQRKKIVRIIDGKTAGKADYALSEDKVRQRLLVGLMLDCPPWIEKYSNRLINKGWVGREADIASALWWDLPSRVEEELLYRRECVLETIQSLQTYFIGLYCSRERQCKLGYDSSGQCDSFQLGEMVRFFSRIGMLQLRGAIFDVGELPDPYDGDLSTLLEKLRKAPEYQIDGNHHHCGIRTRLIPVLDLLEEYLLFLGICPRCWTEDRAHYAWIEAKRPLLWKKYAFRLRGSLGHDDRHADFRAMFTATERDWS